MYEVFFGLASRPFASVPYTAEYFPAATIEAARQTLARCVERGEGAGMVVAPSGTGKTLLCQLLAEQFQGVYEVVLLASGRSSTRRALLQAVLHGLGQAYRGMDEGELRLALVDYLSCEKRCPAGMLLLVDEAHTLPSRLLDEIRTITNLASDGRPRTRLILSGSPLLEETLASPRLESFSQRLVVRCYLEALSRGETEQYIVACLDKAGAAGRALFAPDAYQATYQATNGVPRLINQVCDHSLLLAFRAGRRQIERNTVEEAWADLQQLPTPWNGKTEKKSSSGTIEFGSLDDECSDSAADSIASIPSTLPAPAALGSEAEPADRSRRNPGDARWPGERTPADRRGVSQPACGRGEASPRPLVQPI